MSEIKDGGPAFPVADPMDLEPGTVAEMKRLASGMTLRDYFAVKAMQAFLMVNPVHESETPLDDYAGDAYDTADAMLRARGQP